MPKANQTAPQWKIKFGPTTLGERATGGLSWWPALFARGHARWTVARLVGPSDCRLLLHQSVYGGGCESTILGELLDDGEVRIFREIMRLRSIVSRDYFRGPLVANHIDTVASEIQNHVACCCRMRVAAESSAE